MVGRGAERDVVGVAGVEVLVACDAPTAFVDHVVVLAAEQDHVGDRGVAAVLPVGDVVGFAARR